MGGGGLRQENTQAAGIHITLKMLDKILSGMGDNVLESHERLLTQHLLPLHRPNGLVLWRDQTSLLELYHEPLVQCIAILLQRQQQQEQQLATNSNVSNDSTTTSWIPKVIAALLEPDVWCKGGNTPKLV